jgi:hypothetical protein
VNPRGTRKLPAPSREAAGVVQDAAVACVCVSPFLLSMFPWPPAAPFTAVWFDTGQEADLAKFPKAHGRYWAGPASRASKHILISNLL